MYLYTSSMTEGLEADMSLVKNEIGKTSRPDEVSSDKMREALTAIALELHKLQSTVSVDSDKDYGAYEEVCKKLNKRNVMLKTQKNQIRKLKDNLKTACEIAKSILSAKETENLSLSKHLTFAKNEFNSWMKKNDECCEMVNQLKSENKLLNDKLQNISRFVELGFQELLKICTKEELKQELSTVMKLKHIMICCGQYYADYSNEREKSLQLEQKNRFLCNKLCILENNLRSTTEQLKQLQNQLTVKPKLPKYLKDKSKSDSLQKLESVQSENIFGTKKNIIRMTYNATETAKKKVEFSKCVSTVKTDCIDLSSHLTLVKNLLNHQDTMLNDLRKLSLEMKYLESSYKEK